MPNTEQDYVQQLQEYQRQKMCVWDMLMLMALILVGILLVIALAQVTAEPIEKVGIGSIEPFAKILFFDDVLAIHASGEISYRGRILQTDEEVWHGLQEIVQYYLDREKTCSRRDALLALKAARELLSGHHSATVETTFFEGYTKCFPPS